MELYKTNYEKEIVVKGKTFIIKGQVASYRCYEEWWLSKVYNIQGDEILVNFIDDIHGVNITEGDKKFIEEYYDELCKKVRQEEGDRIPLCWWKKSKDIIKDQ